MSVQTRAVRRAFADVTQQIEKAEGVTQLLLGLFETDIEIGFSNSITARQLLDRGERQAEQLRDQPLNAGAQPAGGRRVPLRRRARNLSAEPVQRRASGCAPNPQRARQLVRGIG